MKMRCECGSEKFFVIQGECVENGVGVEGGMCVECGKIFEGVEYNKNVNFDRYDDEYIVYIEDKSEEIGIEQVIYDCVEVNPQKHDMIQRTIS